MAQIDLRNASIHIFDGSSNSITVKVGNGELSYSEKRQVDFVKSRGLLDTSRLNEEVPLDLSLMLVWEFITSAGGEAITVEDALKRRNGASAWVSASPDSLAPYCVNISVTYTPPCSGVYKETIIFPQAHYIELAHSLQDSTIAAKFTCNSTQPQVSRSA